MPPCKHHEICGRNALGGPEGDELCILHSENPEKDRAAFREAFEEHHRKYGNKFSSFVFPEFVAFDQRRFDGADFSYAVFKEEAVFRGSHFSTQADFRGASFELEADFTAAIFTSKPVFRECQYMGDADFSGAQFIRGADFSNAQFAGESRFAESQFTGGAEFANSQFKAGAVFNKTQFAETARFTGAQFLGDVSFRASKFTKDSHFFSTLFTGTGEFFGTEFVGPAFFVESQFTAEASFSTAQFGDLALLVGTKFTGGADFIETQFNKDAFFINARFLGRMIFSGSPQNYPNGLAFASATVDFRRLLIDPLDALAFRDADLRKCHFLGTDLRKAEITGAKWPTIGGRYGVYDEIAPLREGEARQWSHIERLYRELKQNYEDRRDYERAGDFHSGEKEMRRKNPETSWGLWFVLSLYWLVSGYGERWVRPLLWLVGLLAVSTMGYLWFGLTPKDGGGVLTWGAGLDLSTALEYSLRVMTLLKPDNLVPVGWSRLVNLAQSLLGPVLIGLFALALRQQLRR